MSEVFVLSRKSNESGGSIWLYVQSWTSALDVSGLQPKLATWVGAGFRRWPEPRVCRVRRSSLGSGSWICPPSGGLRKRIVCGARAAGVPCSWILILDSWPHSRA